MNTFFIFALSFTILGCCLGDEEMEKKKEKDVSLYKCLACNNDTHDAYGKCVQLKPNRTVVHLEDCCKKVEPRDDPEKRAKDWEFYCENPVYVEKLIDCLLDEEYLKSLTEEELSGMEQFEDCAEGIREKYCKDD
ncbi:uncharacterized protein NPIL_98121 [Nephila pilipes]|uniref:Uncharacterized protein n=1 Tax=Nephila pilipes TaxID=299642 RepID=A0A8X6QF74_NEPPI|nr:uncharacterized protein NPIL_98121 [Nephila pilipes]